MRIYKNKDIDIPSDKAITMLITLLMTPCAGNQGCHAACSDNCDPLDSLVKRMKVTFKSSNKNRSVRELCVGTIQSTSQIEK